MNTGMDGDHPDDEEEEMITPLTSEELKFMIQACALGNMAKVDELLSQNVNYAIQQDEETGQSPLMAAAATGQGRLCQLLLDAGAPWNAVDRQGQCAGNYATDGQHWGVVNLLVDWAVRAELILGLVQRSLRQQEQQIQQSSGDTPDAATVLTPEAGRTAPPAPVQLDGPVEHQPSTKPDYLRQRLQYTPDGQALLDADQDAVMMAWERPLMQAHAQILMEESATADNLASGTDTTNTAAPAENSAHLSDHPHERRRRSVLNVGFGMGIIDTALQELQPSLHIIIEAHPDVHRRMMEHGWHQRPNVRVCFGPWQQVLPQLRQEGVVVDAIFFDTYGEHYMDMEDFHQQMVHLLSKPDGIYSFFNGLAPDNLFFHGVACQCVKLQLAQLGLDSDFLPCEIQVPDEESWQGIRRKYWHGRDTYYLPKCTWNRHFLATGQVLMDPVVDEVRRKHTVGGEEHHDMDSDGKRPRLTH